MNDPGAAELAGMGFAPFAQLTLTNECDIDLSILDDALGNVTRCIYGWVIAGRIVRIGTSKGPLLGRVTGTRNWIYRLSKGLATRRDPARLARDRADAENWLAHLRKGHGCAVCYARQGAQVTTPVGQINAYLAEENALLERLRPPLNRSTFR